MNMKRIEGLLPYLEELIPLFKLLNKRDIFSLSFYMNTKDVKLKFTTVIKSHRFLLHCDAQIHCWGSYFKPRPRLQRRLGLEG